MRTDGGGRLLRGNPRRRQNRDCDNQAKTSGVATHNLFSRQLSVSEKRRLVISPGHLGKTFRVDTRESGLSGRLLFENDDRVAFGTYPIQILCSCVCHVVSKSPRREQKHYFFGFAL